MGFLLRNDSGETYQFENSEWRNILRVARRNGWQPMGTQPNLEYLNQRARDPDGGYDNRVLKEIIESWKGSYLTKERQFVSYADALNISFALEEAVRNKGIAGDEVGKFIEFCKMGRFSIL